MSDAEWVEPSLGSTVAFVGVVLLVLGMFVAGVAFVARDRARAGGLAALAALGWLLVTALYVELGVVRAGAPGLVGFMVLSNLAAIALALSPLGTRLVEGLPLTALAGFQAFRLPLELVLATWHDEGALPVQMTFEGHNFDIVTGALALVVIVAAITRRREPPRWVLVAFNAIGTILLLAVMVIAMRSAPLPIKAYPGPPLLLALHVPYAWIVPVCVAGALAAHVMSWRAILRRSTPGGHPT